MEAEFHKAVGRIGRFWAKLWYAKEVVSEIHPVVWPRIRRLAGLVTVVEVFRRWMGS
jgi:hypothetical protein